jgi:hypothetical protein
MNKKECFLGILTGEKVDRIPVMDFGYWPETILEWHKQGLPLSVKTDADVERYFGLDLGFEQNEVNGFDEKGEKGSVFRIFPKFPSKVLEEDESSVTVFSGEGVVLRQGKGTVSIPQFIRFPVQTMEDFKNILPRLNGKDPGRIRPDFNIIIEKLKASGEAVGLWIDGFFAWPRELMGLEGLSVALYDEPELVHAINKQHIEFIKDYTTTFLKEIQIDYAVFFEDMAYKNAPLISPQHLNEFMMPYYKELICWLKNNGVKRVIIDSDGNITKLAELFKEAGANALSPCEINAGSTPEVLWNICPDITLIGGVAKTALIAGKDAIDIEMEKMRDRLKTGRYIPAVDHRVPPDVSMENYKYYVECKKAILKEFSKNTEMLGGEYGKNKPNFGH